MSYSPTNWTSGDIITSTKLNKIEQGISDVENSSGVLLITVDENATCNKTALEIKTAYLAGKQIIFTYENNYGISYDSLTTIAQSNEELYFSCGASGNTFSASTLNDYPSNVDLLIPPTN